MTQRKQRLFFAFASFAAVFIAVGANFNSGASRSLAMTATINTPGRPGAVLISPVRVKIFIDPNGNTAPTRFAVQDAVTQKYVQPADPVANVSVLGSAAVFATFAQWGGDDGILLKVTPNTHYRFRVIAEPGA